MSELYRDFIDRKADSIINSLGGTITPAPANAELYRDFLDRKFDDVINALDNLKIKSFTYTGDGSNNLYITIPTNAKYIISIQGVIPVSGGNNGFYSTGLIDLNNLNKWLTVQGVVTGAGNANRYYSIYDLTNNILRMGTTPANNVLNVLDVEYTVYYI